MKNLKTVELYARVSTKYQHTARQAEKLRNYAKDNGSENITLTEETYSGKDFKQPKLNRIWDDVIRGKVSKVVVYRLDRLGRSLSEASQFVKDCLKHGVQLISLEDNLDLSTPMGRMVYHMLMSFAEFERELISLRTAEGLDRSKRTCRVCRTYYDEGVTPSCKCWTPCFVGGTSGTWMTAKTLKKVPKILELFDLGLSKASITKLTGCDFRTVKRVIDQRDDLPVLRERTWDQ